MPVHSPKQEEEIEEKDVDNLSNGDHWEDRGGHHPKVGEEDEAEPGEEEVPEEAGGGGLELDHEEGYDRVQDGLQGHVGDLDKGLNEGLRESGNKNFRGSQRLEGPRGWAQWDILHQLQDNHTHDVIGPSYRQHSRASLTLARANASTQYLQGDSVVNAND